MKKQEKVLEKVYEPRRLLEAWQQVKSNAGAAGPICQDSCRVESFPGRYLPGKKSGRYREFLF